jgi:hypothetical protein
MGQENTKSLSMVADGISDGDLPDQLDGFEAVIARNREKQRKLAEERARHNQKVKKEYKLKSV